MLTTSKLHKPLLPKAVQRASFADEEDGAGVWRSWPPFAEWGSSCALALSTYRGPQSSQISTFLSENKLQQPHIFFEEWKTRGQRCQWKYGGSTEVDHQLCRLAIVTVLLYTLKIDKKVEQNMFQPPNFHDLKFLFFYNKSYTHFQKKIRKITWIYITSFITLLIYPSPHIHSVGKGSSKTLKQQTWRCDRQETRVEQ